MGEPDVIINVSEGKTQLTQLETTMADTRFDDFDAGIQAEDFYSMPDGWQAIEADDDYDMDEEELAWLDRIDDIADYQNEWEFDQEFED